jgi:hypothetical protein
MKNIWFSVLFVISYGVALAQLPEDLDMYKKKHPNSFVVNMKNVEEVTIDIISNDSLSITVKHYEERMYTNKVASLYTGESSVTYSSFNSIGNIDASTVKMVNGKVQKTKVKKFYTKDVLDNNIFYDHQKEISFTYPFVEEGAKSILEYDEVVKDPHFLGNFYFSSHAPSEYSELIVRYSPAVEIDCRLFNVDSLNVQHTNHREKKYTVEKWLMKEGKEYKQESSSPDPRYYLPHAIYFIKNYSYKGITTQVYSDERQLYKWYYTMLENIKPASQEGLNKIVDSLIKDKSTELEKVKSIYYWVQDHIKYIAFEDGMRGFIPESAALVCSNRYGDCKGMANLLVEMMKVANIKSYHAWIGSRSIPYRYKDVPTVYVDNHMIAVYMTADKTYYLDATSKQLSIEYPSAFIQGKEALIGIDKEHFLIQEVPVVEALRNYVIDTAYISIDGLLIKGNGVVHMNGYLKFDLMDHLQNSSREEVEENLALFLRKGNNKFNLKTFNLTNVYDREEDLIITYEFEIKDYVKVNQELYYVNMNLISFNDFKIEKDRERDYFNERTLNYEYVTVLDLNNQYALKYVPENMMFEGDTYLSKSAYAANKDKITLVQHHKRDHLMLSKSDFPTWNKMINAFKKLSNESISLVKK